MTAKSQKKPTPAKSIAATITRRGGKPRKGAGGPMPDVTRLARVEDMLTMMFSPREIERALTKPVAEGGFGVSARTIRDDIRRVRVAFAEESRENAAHLRDELLLTSQKMFRRCLADGDRKTADKYLDKACRIAGAYAPDALRVLEGTRAEAAGMTDATLDAEIERELERTLAALPPERRASVLAKVRGR